MSFFYNSPSSSPSSLRRKTMSITQTYFLAHTARGKLSSEAARADHNLRLLVGHANLLDSLMIDLADAEAEQESWFNASVQSAASSSSKTAPAHIQWADAIIEAPEEEDDEDEEEDSESESDFSDDDDVDFAPLARVPSHAARAHYTASAPMSAADDYEDDGEEDYSMLTLKRTHSHSPPELSHDDSDESEDDSMPPSPPSATPMPSFSDRKMYEQAFYQRGLVSAVSVY